MKFNELSQLRQKRVLLLLSKKYTYLSTFANIENLGIKKGVKKESNIYDVRNSLKQFRNC